MFGTSSESKIVNFIGTNTAVRYRDAKKAKFVRSAHPTLCMASSPECLVIIAMNNAGDDPADAEGWTIQVIVGWKGIAEETTSNAEDIEDCANDGREVFDDKRTWLSELGFESNSEFASKEGSVGATVELRPS